jgi:hypothetical protein
MPKFEQFTKRLIPLSKEPTVTMQARGNLSLNASAFAAMGSPKAVHLLYDRDEHIIGLRPADPEDPNSYKLRSFPRRGETGPHIVTAAAFTTYYEIDTTPQRYGAVFEDGILCIDLKHPLGQAGDQNTRAKQGGDATSSG